MRKEETKELECRLKEEMDYWLARLHHSGQGFQVHREDADRLLKELMRVISHDKPVTATECVEIIKVVQVSDTHGLRSMAEKRLVYLLQESPHV